MPARRTAILELPELNVAIFAVLLNFPWEFLQAPFFEGMPGAAHWAGVQRCAIATLGDATIMLAAFWSAAIVARTRGWILQPTCKQMAVFVGAGLAITVAIERLATSGRWPLGGWAYSAIMPVLPVLDVGLTPILQWILLPLLTAWFVRRQLT